MYSSMSRFERVKQWTAFSRTWHLYDAKWQNPFHSAKVCSAANWPQQVVALLSVHFIVVECAAIQFSNVFLLSQGKCGNSHRYGDTDMPWYANIEGK